MVKRFCDFCKEEIFLKSYYSIEIKKIIDYCSPNEKIPIRRIDICEDCYSKNFKRNKKRESLI